MGSYRQPIALRQARAYWRLSAKAMRAGNGRLALIYQATADRKYAQYRRGQDALGRRQQQTGLRPPQPRQEADR